MRGVLEMTEYHQFGKEVCGGACEACDRGNHEDCENAECGCTHITWAQLEQIRTERLFSSEDIRPLRVPRHSPRKRRSMDPRQMTLFPNGENHTINRPFRPKVLPVHIELELVVNWTIPRGEVDKQDQRPASLAPRTRATPSSTVTW